LRDIRSCHARFNSMEVIVDLNLHVVIHQHRGINKVGAFGDIVWMGTFVVNHLTGHLVGILANALLCRGDDTTPAGSSFGTRRGWKSIILRIIKGDIVHVYGYIRPAVGFTDGRVSIHMTNTNIFKARTNLGIRTILGLVELGRKCTDGSVPFPLVYIKGNSLVVLGHNINQTELGFLIIFTSGVDQGNIARDTRRSSRTGRGGRGQGQGRGWCSSRSTRLLSRWEPSWCTGTLIPNQFFTRRSSIAGQVRKQVSCIPLLTNSRRCGTGGTFLSRNYNARDAAAVAAAPKDQESCGRNNLDHRDWITCVFLTFFQLFSFYLLGGSLW
jgi:nitrate reductase NapE component